MLAQPGFGEDVRIISPLPSGVVYGPHLPPAIMKVPSSPRKQEARHWPFPPPVHRAAGPEPLSAALGTFTFTLLIDSVLFLRLCCCFFRDES